MLAVQGPARGGGEGQQRPASHLHPLLLLLDGLVQGEGDGGQLHPLVNSWTNSENEGSHSVRESALIQRFLTSHAQLGVYLGLISN